MICPNCQSIMKSVKVASTTTGFFVKIEQCPACGGIWCDRYEMAQIASAEAERIDLIEEGALKTSVEVKKDLRCPQCGEPLIVFRDINIPPEAQISRCHRCEGIWLNKTELVGYKKHVRQRQIQNEPIDKTENESVFDPDNEQAISAIGPLMMSIPSQKDDSPFILSKHHIELLREVPPDKKMEIYQIMANEHNRTIEEENRFVDATMTILNIIFRLLLKH